MNEEELPPITGQPQMGVPTPQGLELTEYMTYIRPYPKDEKNQPVIGEGHITEELKKAFNGYLSNDIVWSRLDEKKIRAYKYSFLAARAGYLMSKKYEDINDELLNELDNLQFLVFARLDRALDGWERQKMTEMTQQTFYGQVQAPKTTLAGRAQGFVNNATKMLFGQGGGY